jgi:hypothetical protein
MSQEFLVQNPSEGDIMCTAIKVGQDPVADEIALMTVRQLRTAPHEPLKTCSESARRIIRALIRLLAYGEECELLVPTVSSTEDDVRFVGLSQQQQEAVFQAFHDVSWAMKPIDRITQD